jgi:quinol-cytochrome oxidoreductase complex cytochrome b subunit
MVHKIEIFYFLQSTLTRFYSLHTFVLPLLTAVFMLMHFDS